MTNAGFELFFLLGIPYTYLLHLNFHYVVCYTLIRLLIYLYPVYKWGLFRLTLVI